MRLLHSHTNGHGHHRRDGDERSGHDQTMPSPTRYDWFAHAVGWAYRRVARDAVADVPSGASVLDVGTGPAHLVAAIARHRPDLTVTGVDVDPEMVELARRHLTGLGERATVVVGDALALPFPDDSFDVVVSTLSLHHWPDPAAGAAELDRVRRPGGRVRVYDVSSSPLDQAGAALGVQAAVAQLPRVRISPLPWPTLRRLDA